MQALGNYIMRGRLQAVSVITLLALFSIVLSPFAYLLSGVPVGMITLRRGGMIGMQIIVGCLLTMTLFVLLAQVSPRICLAFAVVIWLPVWLCAIALRFSSSQGLMVLVAGVIGAGFIVIMYMIMDDTAGWWQQWVNVWIDSTLPADLGFQYRQILEPVMPMMNAMIAAGLVVNLVLTMLIARWWQAGMFNPGGFGEEFRALRLPGKLLVFVALGLLLMFSGVEPVYSLSRDFLVIAVFLYLFHGIALVHRLVHRGKLAGAWLYGMYVLLIFVPQCVLFLACIGIADSIEVMARKFRAG